MLPAIASHWQQSLTALLRRSARSGEQLLLRTDLALERIAWIWGGLLSILLVARVTQAALVAGVGRPWLISLPVHALIAFAPLIGVRLARNAFPADRLYATPIFSLRPARWQALDPLAARDHPAFGTGGLIAGLTLGLLLNILVRTGEFLAAVPALASVAGGWAFQLYALLAADCIFFNMLYAMTFVVAVRKNPCFPSLMAVIWMLDIAAQYAIALALGANDVPVQVGTAMSGFLTGNIQKTLISIALWMPYLMLSERVNVTYRSRTAR